MTIRPALPADFEPVYAIWLAGIAHSFAGFAHPADLWAQFEHNFSSCRPPFGFWVAEEAGQVLGWQSLLPCTSNPLKRQLLAEASTYVAASGQGRGVGEPLLRRALAEAAQSGLRFVLAYTLAENARVGQLYERCGFRASGRLTATEPADFYAERLLWLYAVPVDSSAPRIPAP
ncbi:MAG: GNAT family N-acetyltransferase [Janthinobacterium lividum]